jgi:hypothetical protein
MDELTKSKDEHLSVCADNYTNDIIMFKQHFGNYEETGYIVNNLTKIIEHINNIRRKQVS